MNLLKACAIGVVILGASLAGCAQTPQEHRAATGAALGAAGGALVGQAIGRDTGSTLLGAGAGALLGAAVANSSGPPPSGPPMCRYQAPNGHIYVAECDERYYRGGY